MARKPWYTGIPENGIPDQKRYKKEELMRMLGIEQNDLNRYLSLFTACKKRRMKIVSPHQSPEPEGPTAWITGRWPWTEREVLRHLAGKVTLGLHWNPYVDHLMLDFDAHDRTVEETREVTRNVVDLLPGECVIYQSSFSQGIRAICFLDQSYPLIVAAKWLDHKLRENGFTPKSGYIETRMTGQGDRLPFGKGSMLLDSATLLPRDDLDLRDTIARVFDFARQNRLILNKSEIPQDAPDIIKQENESLVQRLKNKGLWAGGLDATQAFLILNRHLQGDLKLSPQQTVKWLQDWIRQKHNGQCGRINRGELHRVDEQIERIVAGFDPQKYGGRRNKLNASEVGLPLNDIRTLLQRTRDLKVLKAGFSLLTYITKKLIKDGNLYISGNQQKVIYVSGNSCDLACQVPWNTLRHLDGFPKENPRWMMEELERLEIIKLKRNYCKERRRCREYSLLFQFSRQHSPFVNTLEEGLILIRNPRELRRLFGRHLAKKILDSQNINQGGKK